MQARAVGPWIVAACLSLTLAACGGATVKTSVTSSLSPTTNPVSSTSASVTGTAPSTTNTPVDASIEVYGNCTSPSLEPTEIVLTCADYGEILEGLRWTNWSASSATAVGTLVYNDCVPNCASGHHHSVTGTVVTLTVPVRGSGGTLVWSQVQEKPEPPGYATGPYQGGPQPLPTQPD